MTPECLFNSSVPRNIFQKKQLAVKTGHNVSESHSPVTAVTGSGEIRPYAPSSAIARIASGIGKGA